MGYNTDFYTIDKTGKFKFLYSISGSDAPQHYDDLKSLDEVDEVYRKISQDNYIWFKWAVPWEDSTTSDDCVLFELLDKKWWEFWKPNNPIQVWHDTYYYKRRVGHNQMYFGKSLENKNIDHDSLDDFSNILKLFTMPQMRIKPKSKIKPN